MLWPDTWLSSGDQMAFELSALHRVSLKIQLDSISLVSVIFDFLLSVLAGLVRFETWLSYTMFVSAVIRSTDSRRTALSARSAHTLTRCGLCRAWLVIDCWAFCWLIDVTASYTIESLDSIHFSISGVYYTWCCFNKCFKMFNGLVIPKFSNELLTRPVDWE